MKTINVHDICNLEVQPEGPGNMVMEFMGGDKRIRLHVPRWWISVLHKKSWEYLHAEEKEVRRLRHAMSQEPPVDKQ